MHESQQHAFPISAAEAAAAAAAAVAVAADTSVSDADDRFVGDVGGPTIRSWSYKGNTHWSTERLLRPTWHKTGYFGDVSSSQSLGLVWKKLNLTEEKHTFTNQKKCTKTQHALV